MTVVGRGQRTGTSRRLTPRKDWLSSGTRLTLWFPLGAGPVTSSSLRLSAVHQQPRPVHSPTPGTPLLPCPLLGQAGLQGPPARCEPDPGWPGQDPSGHRKGREHLLAELGAHNQGRGRVADVSFLCHTSWDSEKLAPGTTPAPATHSCDRHRGPARCQQWLQGAVWARVAPSQDQGAGGDRCLPACHTDLQGGSPARDGGSGPGEAGSGLEESAESLVALGAGDGAVCAGGGRGSGPGRPSEVGTWCVWSVGLCTRAPVCAGPVPVCGCGGECSGVCVHVLCLWAPQWLSACAWTCGSFSPGPRLVLLPLAGLAPTSQCWWPGLPLSQRAQCQLPRRGRRRDAASPVGPGAWGLHQLLAWVTGELCLCPSDRRRPAARPAQVKGSGLLPHVPIPSLGCFLPPLDSSPQPPACGRSTPSTQGPPPEPFCSVPGQPPQSLALPARPLAAAQGFCVSSH